MCSHLEWNSVFQGPVHMIGLHGIGMTFIQPQLVSSSQSMDNSPYSPSILDGIARHPWLLTLCQHDVRKGEKTDTIVPPSRCRPRAWAVRTAAPS